LAEPEDEWRFEGQGNVFFLAVILGAVFISHPPFLREGLMIAAALGSWLTTRPQIHQANHFTFHPIQEVAILFVGIFATMMPALDWLQLNARSLGEPTPGRYYWASGALSSVLDNAPTYLSFLSAGMGALIPPDDVQQIQQWVQQNADTAAVNGLYADQIKATLAALQRYHPELLATRSLSPEQIRMAYLLGNANLNLYLVAISVGAVVFGAFTYIGNGPNFMVKSIADHQKAHAPDFLTYVFKFALPFLLPVLALIWLLFFR
jgi:Na+/H+ antiporter NhaD/arsenite permease-like protein